MSLAAVTTAKAQTRYDRHVLFDNSHSEGGYESSHSVQTAPSTLQTYHGAFPVATERYVSPPNSLRLKWRSAPGGEWRITCEITRRYARKFSYEGEVLAFWIYPEFEVDAENSPRMYLRDRDGHGTFSVTLVEGDRRLPAGEWSLLEIPLTKFLVGPINSTDDPRFSIPNTVSVSFQQGLDEDVERTMYLDDFQIRPSTSTDQEPPGAPRQVQVRGQERHFDITWQASPANDVLTYRIYRAAGDDGEFQAIGTQQGGLTRFVDFYGDPGARARYRVSAIDIVGNESPVSEPSAVAQTRLFNDEELMTMVQEACFRYYWEGAERNSGLAPEVLPGDSNLVALGGSGFGVMALLVATERAFVPRDAAVERMLKIVRFLARADRFKGVWPHFLRGDTGRINPFFGRYDNGGDLVETAFMMQGLLAARQYFGGDTAAEQEIRETITRLWREAEWSWYRKNPDSDVLYWHWSPDHGFHISHPLIGWNETMITYLLAVASPTHPVPADVYHTGWAGTSEQHINYRRSWGRTTVGDRFVNGKTFYGHKLEVGVGNGADLFFTHFSFMGFDPRGLRDRYTNYFLNNRAIALINHAYCVENPRGFVGYGPECWGLSVGINTGGGRPEPRNDNGTISVMAALASMPYTPKESLAALKHFYRFYGKKVFGIYGFHDGFNPTQNWFEEAYMALNQGPIVVMIENHRTGLVWRNFMANPEIAPALQAIGFKDDSQAEQAFLRAQAEQATARP